jgi:hypothetical protein
MPPEETKSLPVVNAENKCGECTACCTLLGVKSLQKDDYVSCQHECAAGCAIYQNRPKECGIYECLWLQQYPGFSERFRPDKLRVICDLAESGGNWAIMVRELDEGVYERDDFVRNWVEYLAFKHLAVIVVVYKQNHRIILTDWTRHLEGKINIQHKSWRDLPDEEK